MLVISTKNSSNNALTGSATFTGLSEDVSAYGQVKITLRAGNAAPGTLYVGISDDGMSFTETSYAVSDPTSYAPFTVTITKTYLRLRYVNGATAQTSFRVQSLLVSGSVGGSGAAPGAATVNVVRQVITLSAGNISTKSFTIASIPLSSAPVTLIPYGGPPQRQTVDFSVTSNTVSWNGLGLEGFLDANDQVEVTYYT